MKPLFLLPLLFLLHADSLGQSKKEQDFRTAVQTVAVAFSKLDSSSLAPFIHPATGLYLVHRSGVFDEYERFATLSFSNDTYPRVLFQKTKGVHVPALRYAPLPRFDCEGDAWSKKGFFVDTTQTDHLLSTLCRNRNRLLPDTISKQTIRFFYTLENKSRRVVLNDSRGSEAVFYLSYLNGRWYLTLFDAVSSDCSS